MDFDYIVVQAGGKGTRLEYLTKNKPKALVPVGNLPMIFHLFRKYPDKRFIIIGDYHYDVLKRYLEAFCDVKYLLVDARGSTGTCAGVAKAIRNIPDNNPFMLIWSDLILPKSFEVPQVCDDYVGLSGDFRCRWSYKDEEFVEEPSYEYGVAGFFLFKDKEVLRDVPNSGELVRWMQSKQLKLKICSVAGTKEYGLLEEYKKMKVEKCRPFNRLVVKGGKVCKEGIDEQGRKLAIREKAWYEYVKSLGYTKIPKIYSFEPFEMELIDGKNVYDYEFTYEERKLILERIISALRELHELGTCEADYFSIKENYVTKTFDRLKKIRDMVPYADRGTITVNGRVCKNVFLNMESLKKAFDSYKCDCFKLLHGDCTFSNMMLDANLEPVLIDPRGYFGYTENYGDELYDWAKLYYSIVGNYDRFNIKKFRLDISQDKPEVTLDIETNGWEDMEDEFFRLVLNNSNAGRDKEELKRDIKLLHAVIWLSLTTYAWEDYDSICGAFYNGLYYLEEIL